MLTNYKGYEFFYVNGSSHTKGGCFEANGWFRHDMVSYYKEHYNVEWTNENEVNWATRLSQLLGIPCYNDAIQGGGTGRVIRMTYQFIESHWDKRDKFFIILETPDPSRVDVYYKPEEKYFIVNSDYNNFLSATENYFLDLDEHGIQDTFRHYFDTFHDQTEYFKSTERNLAGLYSFCKRAGIQIKLMDSHRHIYYKMYYDNNDIISDENNNMNLIDWCIQNNQQVKHETNFTVIDGHPGYFGHINYAKHVSEWLEHNL